MSIAKQEYESYEVGQVVAIDKGKTKIGYVSEVIDNKKTGEQAYIVIPEKLPKKPIVSDLNKVANVTVLYRGSTEPGK